MNLSTESRDAVSDLVDYIRSQGYVRGDRLPSIRQFADALGIGRNAVRDGILRAEALGLVRVEPRSGVFLRNPEAGLPAGQSVPAYEDSMSSQTHNVFHLIDARLLLELELVDKAARVGRAEEFLPLRAALDAVLGEFDNRSDFIAADEAFHVEIARLAGNPVLLAFLRSLQQQFRPIKEGVLLSAQNRQRTDREHIELYRCLLEGRADDAKSLMREHVAQGRDLLLAHLRTMPTIRLDKVKDNGRRRKGAKDRATGPSPKKRKPKG